MSIRTNIFSLTKLFEDGHVMEISLEFERRAKAYNELLAENERLKAKISMSEAIAEICSQPPGEGAVTVKASLSTGKTVLPDIFQVDELKAENERLRKAGEWQPINTAPKDGTDILIRVIMRWDKDAKGWAYFQNPATNAEWMPLVNAAKEGGAK